VESEVERVELGVLSVGLGEVELVRVLENGAEVVYFSRG
jgi:hypothetical protein